MATRSNICIRLNEEDKNKDLLFNIDKLDVKFDYNKDNLSKIKSINTDKNFLQIYHHWDGYPEGLGKFLIEGYNEYDKVLNLILGGDCSTIDPNNFEPYWLRNEDWEYIKPTAENVPELNEEYIYSFENDKWYFKGKYELNEWQELKEYLENNKEE